MAASNSGGFGTTGKFVVPNVFSGIALVYMGWQLSSPDEASSTPLLISIVVAGVSIALAVSWGKAIGTRLSQMAAFVNEVANKLEQQTAKLNEVSKHNRNLET